MNYPINERVLSFGDYAFVVKRPDEFFVRIKEALEAHNIVGSGGKVEYVSDIFTGEISPFQKRKSFEWQSEWRLKVVGGDGDPRIITIGDLSDIAFICKASEASSRFTVTEPGEQ